MDGLFEAQRDSVLSSRSHSEGKRQNQREKSGSSLVLIRGVKGGGQDQSPLSTLLFFAASVSPRSPRAFLMQCSLPFFWWETKARGGEGTHPHRPTHGVPARTGTRSYLCSDQGKGKDLFPTNCLSPILSSLADCAAGALRVAQSDAGGQRWACAGERKLPRRGGAASKRKSAKKPEPQTETKCIF